MTPYYYQVPYHIQMRDHNEGDKTNLNTKSNPKIIDKRAELESVKIQRALNLKRNYNKFQDKVRATELRKDYTQGK